MKPWHRVVILYFIGGFFSIQFVGNGESAFIYKNYVIKRDRGWNILCDPYVVKKNDYVLKLFKQRGEIAQRDFRYFLQVFRRINPHVKNVDSIRPGQHILIPLKILKYGALDGQSTGTVTIPFVTLAEGSGKMESMVYRVRKGDCVSVLIAKNFGAYGTASYLDGIRLFRLYNPEITDINRIYAGQNLRLPDPLFMHLSDAGFVDEKAASPQPEALPANNFRPAAEKSVLEKLATTLDARLMNKGSYFFPTSEGNDFELQLSQFPVLELADGRRFVFTKNKRLENTELNILKRKWKKLKHVNLKPDTGIKALLDEIAEKAKGDRQDNLITVRSDPIKLEIRPRYILDELSKSYPSGRKICVTPIENTSQQTPESISRFLETHDIVIREPLIDPEDRSLQKHRPSKDPITQIVRIRKSPSVSKSLGTMLEAAGIWYFENVRITFPYAGVQTEALSNLISLWDGREMLVDFNRLQKDALRILQQTGFKVITIDPDMPPIAALIRVFETIGTDLKKDPVLLAADRADTYNIKIFFSGLLVELDPNSRVFFSETPINDWFAAFLSGKNIKIVLLSDLS